MLNKPDVGEVDQVLVETETTQKKSYMEGDNLEEKIEELQGSVKIAQMQSVSGKTEY